MDGSSQSATILHVEDDPSLVEIVQIAFRKFGFRGSVISAGRVDEALRLLDQRARNGEPLSLILVDMQLPDGMGLEVIREVKSDPFWQRTPVIVLSGEASADIVDGAYALGANSYFPKFRSLTSPLDSLRTLFECWLKETILPTAAPSGDQLHCTLARSIGLRARTADFYMRLARISGGEPEESGFWLDRALSESNLSNLLAFFQDRVAEVTVSPETVERITAMQNGFRDALLKTEKLLENTLQPGTDTICCWVLDVTDALDDEAVTDAFAALFTIGPEAALALRMRASRQLQQLAAHIQAMTADGELLSRARLLHGKGRQLAGEHDKPLQPKGDECQ